MSHICLIGNRSVDHAVTCYEEHIVMQQPYMDLHCPAEKAHHFLDQEMAVARA